MRPGRWPGSGPGEDRFDQIAANLATAARLVAAGGPAVRAQRPDLRGDVLAAMTRLIHVTYVAAHAVEVALLAERDAVRQRSRRPAPPGLSMPSDAQLTERITQIRVVQDGARAVLGSSWPAALTGAHHEPVPVAVALAAWDAQAYRTLTATAIPTTGNAAGDLVLATQTTTTFLHLGGLVLAAAAETGDIPPQTYRRLLPALTAAQDAWSGLAAAWTDLVPPGYRGVDADLAAAAATTRTALTGLALDGATPATADRMATRADLPHAAAAVADSLIGAANLADAIGHATAHAPIQAPARRVTGLHRRVHGPETDLPVDPTDHIFNHVVDLPDATRALLAGLSRRAALTTAATLRSAGTLTTPAPHHHRRPGPGDLAPATAEHHRRSEPAPAQALPPHAPITGPDTGDAVTDPGTNHPRPHPLTKAARHADPRAPTGTQRTPGSTSGPTAPVPVPEDVAQGSKATRRRPALLADSQMHPLVRPRPGSRRRVTAARPPVRRPPASPHPGIATASGPPGPAAS